MSTIEYSNIDNLDNLIGELGKIINYKLHTLGAEKIDIREEAIHIVLGESNIEQQLEGTKVRFYLMRHNSNKKIFLVGYDHDTQMIIGQ